MRIRQTSRFITLCVLMLSALTIACALVAGHFRELQESAYETRLQAVRLADQLTYGSDRLTAGVRAYAATGDERYRADFDRELKLDRNRDKAVEGLQRLGLSREELDWLAQAKGNSDRLVSLENRAFEAARLKDYETAIGLVYGEEYRTAKESILRPIGDCRSSLESRLTRDASNLATRSRLLNLVALSTLLVNAGAILAALLLFYRRKVVNPLTLLDQNLRDLLAHKPGVRIGNLDDPSEIGEVARSLESYRRAAEEAETQRWVKGHLAEISGLLQTAATPQEFAERLLSKIVPLVHGGCAALYLLDEEGGRFCFSGGYGYRPQNEEGASFAVGEALVGQCALEKKPITLADLPADYLTIVSGLGQATPPMLMAFPILSRERALGVLEIALLRPPTELHRSLLQEVTQTAALNLEILQRNLNASHLLQQMQQQALEIREGEERNRLILESTGEGIFGVDTQGCITFVNPSCCRMLGYSAEELIGQPSHALIHHHRSDGRQYPVEECPMYAAYQCGQSSRVDDELLWPKDGEGLPVEYSATPISKEGSLVGAVVSFSDISGRHQASQLLNRQRSILVSLINSIPDLIFYKDTDGGYFGCNNAFAELVGSASIEIVGQTDEDLFPPEVAADFRQRDAAMLASGLAQSNEEWVVYPDGRRVLLDTLKTPFWTQDGQLLGIIGVSRDITERVRREETFRAVFNAVQDGVMFFDQSGIRELNQAAVNMLGYEHAADLIGKIPYELAPPLQADGSSSHDIGRRMMETAAGGQAVVFEFLHQKRNGEVFSAEVSLTPTFLDGKPVVLGILRDLRERKNVEFRPSATPPRWESAH